MGFFSDAALERSLKKSDVVFVSPDGENPTPNGLYMLSNLDQTFPYPIEIVFAFKKNINTNNNNNNIDVAKVLKQSLAQVLQVYYPLVGGVDVSWDGKMMVDCGGGDGGVPFVEAFCDEEMAAAVGDNIAFIDEKLKKFVYSHHTPYDTILDVPPLSVQVTTFKCGGIILGVGFNHILIDGRGFADFLINWSQIAKGFPLKTCPNLDRSIFSPNQSQQIHISHPEYSKSKAPLIPSLTQKNQHKIILNKSFTFNPTNLAHLKKLALHSNNNNDNDNDNGAVSRPPTNFELISALVWICWTRATQVGPDKTTQIITAVDGRPKLGPPLAPGYFGNGIVWSCARSRARMLTSQPFSYAVGKARDAIKAVNEDYIRSAIDFHEVTRKPLEQENTLWITKWSRLPFYETDFGWGSADQVAPASLVGNLVVYLSQGRESGNLVISVRLPAEAMEVFEELIESAIN